MTAAVPRWAVLAAWATVLCTVPSCLWRLALGFGVDVGFTGELAAMYTGTDILVYVLVLSVASQAASLLTLALVRPWGERLPHRIPFVGGRRIPPAVVTATAGFGAFVVTALCAALTLAPNGPLANPDFPQGTARQVMLACYAPMLAWGPLVAVLTVAYSRRAAEQRPSKATGPSSGGPTLATTA
ncbi:hypothetical protein ACWGB8_17555 [Kitasatospora sp. NPDC054939]